MYVQTIKTVTKVRLKSDFTTDPSRLQSQEMDDFWREFPLFFKIIIKKPSPTSGLIFKSIKISSRWSIQRFKSIPYTLLETVNGMILGLKYTKQKKWDSNEQESL